MNIKLSIPINDIHYSRFIYVAVNETSQFNFHFSKRILNIYKMESTLHFTVFILHSFELDSFQFDFAKRIDEAHYAEQIK